MTEIQRKKLLKDKDDLDSLYAETKRAMRNIERVLDAIAHMATAKEYELLERVK